MHNTLTLSLFFDLLNDQGLLASYLKNVAKRGECSFSLLDSLFFKCQPDLWIAGAFSWDQDLSNDWRAVDELWKIRLNTFGSTNSLNH